MTSVFTMLRKCCNHPYLLEFPLTPDGDFLIDEQIVTSCGKVLLLDRMLPALIHRGHKVHCMYVRVNGIWNVHDFRLETCTRRSHGHMSTHMYSSSPKKVYTVYTITLSVMLLNTYCIHIQVYTHVDISAISASACTMVGTSLIRMCPTTTVQQQ